MIAPQGQAIGPTWVQPPAGARNRRKATVKHGSLVYSARSQNTTEKTKKEKFKLRKKIFVYLKH